MSGTSSSELTATRRFIATRGTATCCPVPGPKGDTGDTGPQGPTTVAKVVNTSYLTPITSAYTDISGTTTTFTVSPGGTNVITVIANVSFRGATSGDEIDIKLIIDGTGYEPFRGYAATSTTQGGVGAITVMGIQNCLTSGPKTIKLQILNTRSGTNQGTVYQASMHILGNVDIQV